MMQKLTTRWRRGIVDSAVASPAARRHRELPLARLASYLGKLAGAERHAAVRLAGDGRLEVGRDGEALRAPGAGADGETRRGD